VSEAAAKPGPQSQIAGFAFAVILLDPALAIAELNPAAESLLGQGAGRLLGRGLFDTVSFEDGRVGDRVREDEGPVVARGVTVRIGGRALRVNLTLSPLASHPGWRVATFSEAGQDDMEGSAGLPGALRAPAILAHEIKNPLAAIRGAGQLIARRLEGKDIALAQVIADETDRITRLLDRMQALGRAQPDPVAPFNLHAAVRNALSTVRAAGMADVALVEEFDPSLPPVLGNRAGLEQVVINLVSNARDACQGREDAAVIVKTRFVSGFIFNAIRPGRPVRLPIELTVSDNGPGVDPALLDQIFEPFVTSKASGQGLGLALVRKIVRDMDGRIAHERDERAQLTHFRVRLPVAKQDAPA
jgi:two-component system, NtrC family, nitrogen regulation sensor histidine kinase GlnL